MMNITTKTIPHIFRNKYLRETSTSVVSSGSGGGNVVSDGDYLPATKEEDGSFKVDIPKVGFTGNIVCNGEVIAYAKGDEGGSTTTGEVTIYDGLDSEDPEIALSANQGRVLKDLIDSKSSEAEISKMKDTALTDLKDGDTLIYSRALDRWVNGMSSNLTEEDKDRWNNKLDKSVWDSAFYFDDSGNIRAKVNLIGEGEISAYGSDGESSGSGAITIVDNLDSDLPDAALSARQGKVIKNLISSMSGGSGEGGGVSSWNDLTDKPTTFTPSEHTHEISEVSGLQTDLNTLTNHTTDTTKHITATERTNWNNKLDKSVWDSVFTISNDSLKIKVNVVGEGEISAYGDGGSGGALTIVDNLDSTSTDSALSANMGRVLKNLIDSNSGGGEGGSGGVSSWNDLTDKPTTFTPSAHTHTKADITNFPTSLPASDVYSWAKASSKPSYSWTEITSKPTSFTPSSHTHTKADITNFPTSLPASDVYSWAKASSKPSYSWTEITSKPSFATVATSGSYTDLSNKPTIPTNTNQLTNGAGFITSSGSITGNAASATILKNSRKIWGQSFDGSGDVSGALSGVTSITASGAVSCASITASGEVTAYSDKRLKTDIKPLESRGALNPVTYTKDGKSCIGFIADEVRVLYPELVKEDDSPDKLLSLNYQQLTAVLYAEIKELRKELTELKKELWHYQQHQ